MAERSVCMRVCRHLVASRCFAFRALIMPTQARIWKRFRVQNSTCLLYLPIPLTAETCKIVTNKPCQFKIACVASVSAGVRRESWKESKKRNDVGGGGGWERRNRLPANHTIFKTPRSPTNAVSDWCGASSVDWLALETSIKQGMLYLRASQIWSHLIRGRRLQMLWTDIYLNRIVQRFMRSESSKYIWRSSSGD